jgi:ubiquinone/menaquinone biosynthesis C-methylase UbiE
LAVASPYFLFFTPCDALLQNNFYWNTFTKGFKSQARNFFIKRAEKKGIPWNNFKNKYQNPKTFQLLEETFKNINNSSMIYPEYFLQPFHGYEDGNMNWDAAFENEASTLSISSNYWNNIEPIDAAIRMRSAFHNSIKDYQHDNPISSILDVGCSVGISTTFLKKAFPKSHHVEGIDLSPYFLAIASFNEKNSKELCFSHQNAEFTNFKDQTFDLVCSSFLFHELSKTARLGILKEIYRTLQPQGVIAILDLNPSILKEKLSKNQLRKIFFESTEPHIYDYYQSNLVEELESVGFSNIKVSKNDPFNSVWLASKI